MSATDCIWLAVACSCKYQTPHNPPHPRKPSPPLAQPTAPDSESDLILQLESQSPRPLLLLLLLLRCCAAALLLLRATLNNISACLLIRSASSEKRKIRHFCFYYYSRLNRTKPKKKTKNKKHGKTIMKSAKKTAQ